MKTKPLKNICLATALLFCANSSFAQTLETAKDVADRRWGDQRNGTFVNPVLLADYSDPDVIRVGDRFYMICSEFHYMGIPILESKDMINWKILTQVYDRINLAPYSEMKRYGGGSWAPSLRYHNNKFWIYFCTPSEGLFMTSADKIEGPWTPLLHVKNIEGWEDPCPFWDVDGSAYIGRSQLGGGPIIIHRMSPDGTKLLDEGKTVYEGPVAEGTKIFTKNNYYYISIPEGGVSTGWQTVLRSKNIYGPYEKQVVLEEGTTDVNGPHQGAFVDDTNGNWWFYHFQSKEPQGRVVHLQPVEWKEDWPKVGVDKDNNGIGEPVKTWKNPLKVKQNYVHQSSDQFNTTALGLQWQFNHNPVDSDWSLSKKKGHLTLTAAKASKMREARNMLTQKQLGYRSTITTLLKTEDLIDGQRAGLFCIGNTFRGIGVLKNGDKQFIYIEKDGEIKQIAGNEHKNVYLKLQADGLTNQFQWFYSFDNKSFIPIDKVFDMHSGDWKGTRFGIFTYNTQSEGGDAHFDWFTYNYDGPGQLK